MFIHRPMPGSTISLKLEEQGGGKVLLKTGYLYLCTQCYNHSWSKVFPSYSDSIIILGIYRLI